MARKKKTKSVFAPVKQPKRGVFVGGKAWAPGATTTPPIVRPSRRPDTPANALAPGQGIAYGTDRTGAPVTPLVATPDITGPNVVTPEQMAARRGVPLESRPPAARAPAPEARTIGGVPLPARALQVGLPKSRTVTPEMRQDFIDRQTARLAPGSVESKVRKVEREAREARLAAGPPEPKEVTVAKIREGGATERAQLNIDASAEEQRRQIESTEGINRRDLEQQSAENELGRVFTREERQAADTQSLKEIGEKAKLDGKNASAEIDKQVEADIAVLREQGRFDEIDDLRRAQIAEQAARFKGEIDIAVKGSEFSDVGMAGAKAALPKPSVTAAGADGKPPLDIQDPDVQKDIAGATMFLRLEKAKPPEQQDATRMLVAEALIARAKKAAAELVSN